MNLQNDVSSGLSHFLAELGRRHVVRFALGYAAAAFVLLQLAEIVFPAFGFGDIWLRALVIAVALGFLPAVVLAWVFDLTPEGLKRTEDLPQSPGAGHVQAGLSARVALVVLTFVIAGGLALTLIDTGALTADGFGPSADADRSLALTEYDPGAPVTSLAVLALDDFTEGGGQEYFTSGMQEELITQLSQVPGLRVVSRTSVARYAGSDTPVPVIGRALGVDAIIEGSVVRSGDRVRITIQLIHASSDTHIWSARYDRDLTDVLTLQSEVALEVVRAILGEISPEDDSRLRLVADRDVDPTAQDAYLRGKEAFDRGTPEGYDTAMVLFGEAVEADSAWAPALAGLASSRFLVTMEDAEQSPVELERAHVEARRAFELDSTSVEAREVFKYIEQSINEVMPSHALEAPHPPKPKGGAVYVMSVPGVGDSVVITLEAMDSAWVGAVTRLGSGLERRILRWTTRDSEGQQREVFAARHLLDDGQYSAASSVLEDILEVSPELDHAWKLLIQSAVASEEPEAIVAAFRLWSDAAVEGSPDGATVDALAVAVDRAGMTGYWSWTLAILEARRSRGEPVSTVELASAHAGLGQTEEALRLLAEALSEGDRRVLMVPTDPAWDEIRRDPRYQQMSRQIRSLRFASPRQPQD